MRYGWKTFGLMAPVSCFAIFVTALTTGPARGQETVVNQAFQLRLEGKIDEAKKLLEQELAGKPKQASAWCELARLEFQRGGKTRELDSAQRAIEKAVAESPTDPKYYRWAARIAVFNGILKSKDKNQLKEQLKKATLAGEKAIALDPSDHEARRILVSLYGNNPADLGGNRSTAETHVRYLEKNSPVDGLASRCELSFGNNHQKQLDQWTELAKSNDGNALVFENMAIQYAWLGNVEQASLYAQKALQKDATRSQVLMKIARAFALQKKDEPAKKFAQEYLDVVPSGPLAYRAWTQMALGRIQAMSGDKQTSEQSLKKAVETDAYCWQTMTPPPEQLFSAP